ncbi:hypothetical protein EsH8_II_000988 [Colletotrichum jinshuiense]
MPPLQGIQITRAYRHLYRELLRAVQFEAPYRYVVRDQLRTAFREKGGSIDSEEYKRTKWFLQAASRESGVEHKILKNLVRVAHERHKLQPWRHAYRKAEEIKDKTLIQQANEMNATAYDHFDMTVTMLNKTMGIRLR